MQMDWKQPGWNKEWRTSWLRTLLVASVLCGLFCGMSVGQVAEVQAAAKKVRIVVMPRFVKGISEKQTQELTRAFRSALRKQRRLVTPAQKEINQTLYSRQLPADVPDRIKRMTKHLKKAKKLYHVTLFPLKKRCGYALKVLHLANQEAKHLQNLFTEPDLMRDLYFYYSLAYLGRGEREKSVEYMRKLIRMAPSFAPEQNKAPDDYVRLYQQESSKLKQRQYTMKLDSVPSGAKVYHNYRLVGTTPVTLSNMVPGRHWIRIVKMKYLVWERVANLDPQKLGARREIKARVPLKLDPKSLTVAGVPIYEKDAVHSDDILDRLEQITARMKADYLYVIEPQTTQENGYKLRVAIYKKGIRTIYYQTVSLGPSLNSPQRALRTYSRKIRRQVTSNFFKPPKVRK